MSRIAVIGTGYVGLTTGACFAKLGHDVRCTDIDANRVAELEAGRMPILETGLEEVIREAVDADRLSFTTSNIEAAEWCEFAYLCVPTPQGADGSADLSYIEAAAGEIGPHLPSEAVVVNKSTVPVGSTRVVERVLGRSDVFVVSNPEFLREGSAVHDFLNPDRIVIGADDQAAAVRVASLYIGVTAPLIVTDPASAETIKYAANAFLATKISFINAVAAVTEAVGADINDVVLGMGYDKRIGHEFLRPGPGWGGSCFMGDDTLLVRRGGHIELLSFEELWNRIECEGHEGFEALSWRAGEPTPEFLPIGAFTKRGHDGEIVELRTKMGRRLTVTADHGILVGDGVDGETTARKLARDVMADDWVPIAQGFPIVERGPERIPVLDAALAAGVAPEKVIVRLSDEQFAAAMERRGALRASRRHDLPRTRCLRLHELQHLGIDPAGGLVGTTTNGTYVPTHLELSRSTLRMIGLYLAEGHIGVDGTRHRVAWSFHPAEEQELVDEIVDYWSSQGVKVSDSRLTTTHQVSVSSRILADAFRTLGLGTACHEHSLPALVWHLDPESKRALLRALWDGDGSWSFVNRGNSVVLEYGTVSSRLADGMLRLLGDLDVTARLKVGRTGKSSRDAYWLSISGAEQINRCLWLLPVDEACEIADSQERLQRTIKPTGYRELSKNASWVRVVSAERRRYSGPVYSVEVPLSHTVVTTNGLVTHQCFPKDSRALVRIAEDAGYHFDLLKGVITVNDEQFDRVAQKAIDACGGSVDGRTVAVWGLTFKARTDDMRESPALEVIKRLRAAGAHVKAYDPAIGGPLDDIEVVDDPYAACEDAEVLVVLTEWDEFKWVDLDKVADTMAARRIVDARNLLDQSALERRDFVYRGIGRN